MTEFISNIRLQYILDIFHYGSPQYTALAFTEWSLSAEFLFLLTSISYVINMNHLYISK